ncbi:hypothetical protein Dimus_024908, partial [Dionaea muscipula]
MLEQNQQRCRAKQALVVATNVVVPTDGLLGDREEPDATRTEPPFPEHVSKWNDITAIRSRVAFHQAKAGPHNRSHDENPPTRPYPRTHNIWSPLQDGLRPKSKLANKQDVMRSW